MSPVTTGVRTRKTGPLLISNGSGEKSWHNQENTFIVTDRFLSRNKKGPPEVRASATARTKRPHKHHTGSDPKCSCDAYLTPVSLQDRSKNGKPNPFSRPDKPARLHPGPGRHLDSCLERQRCIDGFQTSQEPSAGRITVSPTGPKNLRKIHR